MLSLNTVIKTREGLHSRAAAAFVQQTNKYICEIYISLNDITVDAKSIMGILSLGIDENETVLITFNGVDEKQAKAGLLELINTEISTL